MFKSECISMTKSNRQTGYEDKAGEGHFPRG